MLLSDDAAKYLEAAWRELEWSEERANQAIERASTLAAMDHCDRIEARHMLQAIAER